MLNHTTEIWKDIKDFEGNYQVSSLGRIRSIRTSQGTYRERIKKKKLLYLMQDMNKLIYLKTMNHLLRWFID